MYIIVFTDCNYVRKPDAESAFSLPGDNYIFSTGGSLELSKPEGICFYNKNKEIENFRLKHLQLIDISRISSQMPYVFSIYNHNTKTIQQITGKGFNIDYALPEAIKEIISASNFSNWSDYEVMLNIENYVQQIKDLQNQLNVAKEQNRELENKINLHSK